MQDQQGDGDAPTEGRTIELELSSTVHAAATVNATSRFSFTSPHLTAAEHFAAQVLQQEREFAGEGWGDHFDLCMWNASAAIILSFSAIEAAVDEAEDDLEIADELANALERASTLDHVQALLAHRGAPVFDKGAEPFQSAELLRVIRNGLVHPRAEWDNAPDRNQQLTRKIVGAGLPLSPFQPDPARAFPRGIMSAGASSWAASSARRFIREFRIRLGLNPIV